MNFARSFYRRDNTFAFDNRDSSVVNSRFFLASPGVSFHFHRLATEGSFELEKEQSYFRSIWLPNSEIL
jgi:hypothetical protein